MFLCVKNACFMLYVCVYYYIYILLQKIGTLEHISIDCSHRAVSPCSKQYKLARNASEHIGAKDLTIQHRCALRVFQAVRSALIMRLHIACSFVCFICRRFLTSEDFSTFARLLALFQLVWVPQISVRNLILKLNQVEKSSLVRNPLPSLFYRYFFAFPPPRERACYCLHSRCKMFRNVPTAPSGISSPRLEIT